jgi:hypothetical protein
MSKYAVAAFLLLYGVTIILKTEIPMWVNGVVALGAGLVCLADGFKSK